MESFIMLSYADFSIAPDGDVLIITDGAGLSNQESVVCEIKDFALFLRADGVVKCTIDLELEDLNTFQNAPAAHAMDVRSDGSSIVFNNIKIEGLL